MSGLWGVAIADVVQFVLAMGGCIALAFIAVDHVGGVDYFRDHNPGLQVVAQAGNPEHQAYDGRLAAFRGNRSATALVSGASPT